MAMKEISFIIEGQPKGKDRPRFFNGHAYTTKATREYEKRVCTAYADKCKGHCFNADIPLSIEVTACFTPPKSWSKKKQKEMLGRWAMCKPDGDNILKIVMDALNGVAYVDDKQVVHMNLIKHYTLLDTEESYVAVRISDVSE